MDQDNQKNLLVAIVLSVAVLLMWQMFYAGPKLKEDQERRQRIQQEQQTQPKEQPGRRSLPPRRLRRARYPSRAPPPPRRLCRRAPRPRARRR
jgi:YidC/Oxa1 family membrane protein insertase